MTQWRSRAKSAKYMENEPQQPPVRDKSAGSLELDLDFSDQLAVPPYSPLPPDQDIVIQRFILDYVPPEPEFVPWMNFMKPLPYLHASSLPGSSLSEVVLAVSYANLTGRVNSQSLRGRAMAQYGKALRVLNASLESPVEAIKNETILSVTLLSLFEAMMSDGGSRETSVNKHVCGALMLTRMRGRDIMSTDTGKNIFLQLYFQAVGTSSCHC